MMGGGAGFYAHQAGLEAREDLNNVASLQFSANDNRAGCGMAWTCNTDLAISSPIVVISSMDGSSDAAPNNTAIIAHRDAGGGAVHSIKNGPEL
jgi:hypothetical protein